MAINKSIKAQFNKDYKNDEVIDIEYKLLDNGKKSYTIIFKKTSRER